MSLALVPIKHLSQGKSRLLPRLERADLELLSLAMLSDIIEALGAATRIDRVAVVTPDPSVARHAEAAGAIALLRDDPGLNPSIDNATRELAEPGEPVLVVLGDVAGALPEELDALFLALDAAPGGRGAVLAASRDGGTSALLRAPWDVIPSCFGPNSASEHAARAAERGVACTTLSLESLAIDLDRAEDVEQFLDRPGGGAATRRQLAALGWKADDGGPQSR